MGNGFSLSENNFIPRRHVRSNQQTPDRHSRDSDEDIEVIDLDESRENIKPTTWH